jgi:hypothetical protein
VRLYWCIHRQRQIGAAKNDARVHRRGAQRQLHPLAAVQAHAHGLGQGFEGALRKHVLILGGPVLAFFLNKYPALRVSP